MIHLEWLYRNDAWLRDELEQNYGLTEERLMSEHVDANGTGNGTCPNKIGHSSNESCDSREKLEADVRKVLKGAYMLAWMHGHENRRGCSFEKLHSEFYCLLDRQAAITTAECERICDTCEWPSLAAQPDREAYDRTAELTAELKSARQAHAQAEHDAAVYREKLSRALDLAHEIRRLND